MVDGVKWKVLFWTISRPEKHEIYRYLEAG